MYNTTVKLVVNMKKSYSILYTRKDSEKKKHNNEWLLAKADSKHALQKKVPAAYKQTQPTASLPA